jgi:hypothetical protein
VILPLTALSVEANWEPAVIIAAQRQLTKAILLQNNRRNTPEVREQDSHQLPSAAKCPWFGSIEESPEFTLVNQIT